MSGPRTRRCATQLAPLAFDVSLAGTSHRRPLDHRRRQPIAILAGFRTARSRRSRTPLDADSATRAGLRAVGDVEVAAHDRLCEQQRRDGPQRARAPARQRGGRSPSDDFVLVGAHVDHLGKRHSARRPSPEEETSSGQIHPGADDNASGVAAMIEVARSISSSQPRRGRVLRPSRDIVFAAWSGEELGLLGSSHSRDAELAGSATIRTPGLSGRIVAYLNSRHGRPPPKIQPLRSTAPDRARSWPRSDRAAANVPDRPSPSTPQERQLPARPTRPPSFYTRGVPILSRVHRRPQPSTTRRATCPRRSTTRACKRSPDS